MPNKNVTDLILTITHLLKKKTIIYEDNRNVGNSINISTREMNSVKSLMKNIKEKEDLEKDNLI